MMEPSLLGLLELSCFPNTGGEGGVAAEVNLPL